MYDGDDAAMFEEEEQMEAAASRYISTGGPISVQHTLSVVLVVLTLLPSKSFWPRLHPGYI